MSYEADVLKLVEEWRSNRPTQVRIEEAWKVARYFFPESEIKKNGSHLYVVKWSWLAKAIKKLHYSDWPPFNYKGELLLVVKKNKVKGFYINKLLKAIEIKESCREQEQESKD